MNTPRFPVQDEPEDDYAEARRYAEEQMADAEDYGQFPDYTGEAA